MPISNTTIPYKHLRIWQINPTDIPQLILEPAERVAPPHLYQQCEFNYYYFNGNFSRCSEYKWAPLGNSLSRGYKCSNGHFHTWELQTWSLILAIVFSWFGFFPAHQAMGELHPLPGADEEPGVATQSLLCIHLPCACCRPCTAQIPLGRLRGLITR